MVSFFVLVKIKGYLLRILLKKAKGILLNKEIFFFGIFALRVFKMILFRIL